MRVGTGIQARAGLRWGTLVAAAAMITACAGSAAAPAPTASLDVVLADDWADTQVVADAVADFESTHPGVRVNLLGVPFPQIPSAVQAAEDAGTPFDVAQWHAFAAAARDLAQPVDDLWDAHLDPGEFVPGAVADVEWAGRRYGVPLDTNALVLLVNRDALAEADVSPGTLTSFAALADAADAVTASSAGDQRRWGMAVVASSWTTYGFIRANGGEVVEVAGDGEVTFTLDSPKVIEAVAYLAALIRDGSSPQPYARDVHSDTLGLFQSGGLAMYPSGSWDVDVVTTAGVDDPVDVVAVPLPRGSDTAAAGTALGGSSLFVPTGSAQRELAFAFMTHLTADGYALRLAEEEGRLPVRHRVLDDPYFVRDPAMAVTVAELEHAHPMKLIAFPDATNALRDAIESVFGRGADATAALRRAQRLAEDSL